ncbi:sigma-70 family RNA polymerase sigma factor [Pedobacter nyackensis]|uniref:sigma-70 family RNA polymerase sigma factor n=1 Tax=Pedobacter nyackensis TaxID=475255 RepID=UPI00292EB9DB|nr:sigma-70 family RNA polymerase sigma factor [Pedobacter nyackensis]
MGNIIDNLNDNELFALVKQDNEEAFTLLYHRYWKKMLCKAIFKLQSDFDAEEVVQDVFIDIWNSRRRIIIQNSFHTYVSAILRFKIMAKMAVNKKLASNNVEEIDHSYVVDDSTQQWLNFYNLQSEIEMSVKELPEKCQLVFRMSRESGLTDKQIANDLGLSQKTVEAHISRALRSLRTSIGQFLTFF